MIRRSALARVALLIAAACAFAAASLLGIAHAAASSAPPADPSAKGYIGFCDRSDHQITGGSINDVPFVWKAVSSQAPPTKYLGNGQSALMSIYQLRPDTSPADWSGEQMTADSYFTTPRAPAAIATTKDDSLASLMHDFPPKQDGLYQLRMFFGKVNYGTYSQTYPATYIRVQGDRWSVASGGAVDCAAARAQSVEVLVGTVPAADSGGAQVPAGVAHLPSSSPPPGSSTGVPPRSDVTAPVGYTGGPVAGSGRGSGSSTGLIAALVAAGAVVVVGSIGGTFWLRRRQV